MFMPYSITTQHKDCSTFAVVKDDDYRLMGCHKTREAAKRQIAALYASEGNMKKAEPHKPTAGMKAEAKRGLAWRKEFNRGGTQVGVSRARDIINADSLPLETVKRMYSFFSRHEVDKKAEGFRRGEKGYPSAGRVAWALWGGDAGFSWSKKIVASHKKAGSKVYDYEKETMDKRLYDKGYNDWQQDSMTLLLMAYRDMLDHPECEGLLEPLMGIIHMKQEIMLEGMEVYMDEEEEYEYALEQPTLQRIKRASLRQLTKWINGMDKMGSSRDVAVMRAYVEAEIKNRISKAGFVVEKAEAKRYTLGPVYVPGVEDAHGEFTDDNTLQEALWGWMQKDDRSIYLQHSETKAGEFVELLTWPFAMNAEMALPDQEPQEFEFPPNTPFMGVIWEPWAWDLVQQGELRGYSIGGTARRVEADLGELVSA